MKTAILGVAHVHARQLLDVCEGKTGFEIVGIWDRDPAKSQELSSTYGVPMYDDMDALLATKPDGICIFSENVYHKKLCLKAAEHVKNILCEKPLATNSADAKEMVDVCKKNGVDLRVAFNNRFTRPAIQAKKCVDARNIGDIVGITGTNHGNNPGGWFIDKSLSGGGSMIDHTVHLSDLVCWITGLKPVSVYAVNSTVFNDIPCEDCGTLIVELEGNVPFTIDFSWSRPVDHPVNGDNRLTIDGTRGYCHIDNRGEALEDFKNGNYSVKSYVPNAYDEMIEDFIRSIKHEHAWGATGEEALLSVKIFEAAYESCRTGKKVNII